MNNTPNQYAEDILTGRRVQCLYRVSTDQQVTYSANKEADIPMQRKACHRFAEQMGWQIVFEDQEDGVSGHKVRAEKRDKIQLIKERVRKKQFDILLVFMFDRIGRIADETPFVVEWFVKNGIRVWSTQEGEQRFECHTDKLINYIRFWQADGESEKTSIRTATSMGQLVEEGFYTGGVCPYGYSLVKQGRKNKRGQDVSDLVINPEEAEIVKLIFQKYVVEKLGPQSITTYLFEQGIKNRAGKNWHHSSINGMISNITYIGILRSKNSYSPVLEHLVIIDKDIFAKAQEIKKSRKKGENNSSAQIFNISKDALLSGKVYCGHCGSRLTLTANNKYSASDKRSEKNIRRVRYICYGKNRRQTECDGQTGYTKHILDDIVDKMLQEIFSCLGTIPKQELLQGKVNLHLKEKQAILKYKEQEYFKITKELEALKQEIVKAIQGESVFKPELLSQIIQEREESLVPIKEEYERAKRELEGDAINNLTIVQDYDEIISYAQIYKKAPFETKKTIIASLIERIDVYRGYEIKIKFSLSLEQFLGEGADFRQNKNSAV